MIIHKYKIEPPRDGTTVIIEMPKGAHVLSAGFQSGEMFLWAEFDQKQRENKQARAFQILPTGVEFDNDLLSFIDTVELWPLVFHIFEDLDFKYKDDHI